MRAHFGLPSVRNGMLLVVIYSIVVTDLAFDVVEEVDKRAPISVKFEIPYFTGEFVRPVLLAGTVWLIECLRLSIWNPG